MAFKFPLAAVLKYREELEKREERILEQRRETLVCAQTQLAEAREYRRRLLVEREVLLGRSVLGDDLHHIAEQQQQLEELEEDLQGHVAAALLDCDKQMKLFLVARQKREILNELKTNQKDFHDKQQERREQQVIDEIFSARLNRDI
jgi:flagellar FliJ protein